MLMSIEARRAQVEAMRTSTASAIIYHYTAPRGHTLEMCSQAEYWVACAAQIGERWVNDARVRIEILAADGTWEAELRVLSVIGPHVETRVIREWHAAKDGQGRWPMPIEASCVLEGAA